MTSYNQDSAKLRTYLFMAFISAMSVIGLIVSVFIFLLERSAFSMFNILLLGACFTTAIYYTLANAVRTTTKQGGKE